jgi:uncharacterized RDD family membrane protein YckC
VAATVVDGLPIAALAGLALVLMWLTRNRLCDGDPSVRDLGPQCGGAGVGLVGQLCFLVCWLAMIGYGIWNFGYRQGRSGSSLGKSALKLRIVSAATREPIGFWRSMIRQLAHVLDAISLGVGFLWPLWDRKHQTFADKLAATMSVSGMR